MATPHSEITRDDLPDAQDTTVVVDDNYAKDASFFLVSTPDPAKDPQYANHLEEEKSLRQLKRAAKHEAARRIQQLKNTLEEASSFIVGFFGFSSSEKPNEIPIEDDWVKVTEEEAEPLNLSVKDYLAKFS